MLLAGFISFKVFRAVSFVEKTSTRSPHFKLSSKNEFSNVFYKSYDDKNSNDFSLTSSKIKEKDGADFDFQDLVSTFQISENEMGTISAKESHLVSKNSKKCSFRGDVKLTTNNGLKLQTEESFVDLDKKIAKGNTDIFITQNGSNLFSKKYYFDMKNKIITLEKQVKGCIEKNEISSDKLVLEFEKILSKDLKKIYAFGNPIYKTENYILKSEDYIKYEKEKAEANKKVNLKYEKEKKNYDVSAEHLTVFFENNVIKKLIAENNLIMKIGNETKVKGNRGILENDLLTITDHVIISNKNGNVLCEKAVLNTRTDEMKIYNSKGIINKKDK